MDDLRHQIGKIIELEYKKALNKGLLNPKEISNKIWTLLVEEDAIYIPVPESASGCFEDFED